MVEMFTFIILLIHLMGEDDDGVDSLQNQYPEKMPTYPLKNIVCEKSGSTNNTIIISAHYDSRMEDINNSICASSWCRR